MTNNTDIFSLSAMPLQGPIMWVLDTKEQTILEATPAAQPLLLVQHVESQLRTESEAFHWAACEEVVRSGKVSSQLEWIKYAGSWRKLVFNKIPMTGNQVLSLLMDITHLDPRAVWLDRINLQSQRLELESGGSISFPEYAVLRMLVEGRPHSSIAKSLGISTKTVEYRISKLKIAMQVETTVDMMLAISSTGLIHLSTVEMPSGDPVLTEVDLYRRVVG